MAPNTILSSTGSQRTAPSILSSTSSQRTAPNRMLSATSSRPTIHRRVNPHYLRFRAPTPISGLVAEFFGAEHADFDSPRQYTIGATLSNNRGDHYRDWTRMRRPRLVSSASVPR